MLQEMVRSSTIGFPRIGPRRELKKALEGYWSGRVSAADLAAEARALRQVNWELQRRVGIDHIPSGDFSLYDHVLDAAVMIGAIPGRYWEPDGTVSLDSYFAMARGGQLGGRPVGALEMTKWFDTNYHYLVPELAVGQRFEANPAKIVDELHEASELGIQTRPVLLGPVSFLLLSKRPGSTQTADLSLLPALIDVYEEVLVALAAAGASWVQIDEPALGLDLPTSTLDAYRPAYDRLADAAPGVRLLVATYFTGLRRNLPIALALPVAGLHLDLVADPDQLEAALSGAPESLTLSLGVVDGRNVWKSDLEATLGRLEAARNRLGPGRLIVAPSCSLLHLPVDLETETALDPEVRRWLAFATQRVEELRLLTRGLNDGRDAVSDELAENRSARAERTQSPKVHNRTVTQRVAEAGPDLEDRSSPHTIRKALQGVHHHLPAMPTTTIGSFPQTAEVRSLRARYRRGDLDSATYETSLQALVAATITLQLDIGLDVLVHGEFERNDMVEYFGECLDGYAVTGNGWVQSYGSRCVKPPILYGDVSRPRPITVAWTAYAQSLTDRPVKGMLTGPVTMLQWSFVRDDQPRSLTCRQLALAIRDEVVDLESAGARIIQIDEPALREGLPLHEEDRPSYLSWAVAAFRLASSGVADGTQIHTHMCYANFDDIIDSIVAFDADVISIEAARSGMELLDSFAETGYPNDIGPGIWDIHSPRVPTADEMASLLRRAVSVFGSDRVWINPDCGLKTRSWAEVGPSLRNLVEAARRIRAGVKTPE